MQDKGPRFLFKGWTPAFVRLGPNTILLFVFYEVSSHWHFHSASSQFVLSAATQTRLANPLPVFMKARQCVFDVWIRLGIYCYRSYVIALARLIMTVSIMILNPIPACNRSVLDQPLRFNCTGGAAPVRDYIRIEHDPDSNWTVHFPSYLAARPSTSLD